MHKRTDSLENGGIRILETISVWICVEKTSLRLLKGRRGDSRGLSSYLSIFLKSYLALLDLISIRWLFFLSATKLIFLSLDDIFVKWLYLIFIFDEYIYALLFYWCVWFRSKITYASRIYSGDSLYLKLSFHINFIYYFIIIEILYAY